MDSTDTQHDSLPVIHDDAQLDAYLAACAAARPEAALDGLRMTRDAWLARSDDQGEAAWAHARRLGLALVDLAQVTRDPSLDTLFPEAVRRRLRMTPLRAAHGWVAVAIDAETDDAMVSSLGFVSSRPVVALVATGQARRGRSDARADREEDGRIATQLGLVPGQRAANDAAREEALANESTMIRAMRALMASAVDQRASDVHIRPGAAGVEVLFRIDGNMVHQREVIPELAAMVVNRIKVFAGLDIAERRRPQDGRGTFRPEGRRPVDLRVSTVPTVHGESVVIRLLDTEESLRTLDEIQLTPADRAELDAQISRPHGLFLATGPTGSGKSTTLYAALQALRTQPINILTVEDPVEYTLAGIRQMEVCEEIGVTFASALRSFLRHDPDVIMVGEIRDRETARMAVESALTGHLVLSTLHTNTAASTLTRLLELGVEAYLLRAALTGVIAQRLVRLTCEHCRVPEDPAPPVRAALGVGPDERFSIGRGCPRCHGTGVFRRRAVYELMPVTPALRALIAPGVEADRLHAAALAGGMVPITAAALQLAREGHISLTEAYRVRAD